MNKNFVKGIRPKRVKDITGEKFSKLLVEKFYGIDTKNNTSLWQCKCDCGKKTIVRRYNIIGGGTKSCGCDRIIKLKDKKFGLLYVKKFVKIGKYGAIWECKCDCGNVKNICSGHLISGKTTSCGFCKSQIIDIIDQEFGFLKVISFSYTKNKNAYWNCKCMCGNKVIIAANNLKRGNTKSCGCMSNKLQEQTNMKKYGTKSTFQNKNVRNKFEINNIKKYGVPYPAQNKDIALKTAKSQKNSFILYHWKTNKELVCIASYEKKVVEYLNKNKINFRWQPKVFKLTLYNGKNTTYRPDLYLYSTKKWIEIKGYFRKDAQEKWDIFQTIKPNSELWNKDKLKTMGIL